MADFLQPYKVRRALRDVDPADRGPGPWLALKEGDLVALSGLVYGFHDYDRTLVGPAFSVSDYELLTSYTSSNDFLFRAAAATSSLAFLRFNLGKPQWAVVYRRTPDGKLTKLNGLCWFEGTSCLCLHLHLAHYCSFSQTSGVSTQTSTKPR